MKKLLGIILALACVGAQATHVQFNFQTGQQISQPLTNRPFVLTPATNAAPTSYGNYLISRDAIYTNTGNGSIIVSNLLPIRWDCRLTTSLGVSTWQILVPDTNAVVQASTIAVTPTQTSTGYTTGASDARYVRNTNGVSYSQALSNPSLTNGANYGNAFSSPNTSYAGSEQFGSGASATAASATAIGNTAQAQGQFSLAAGYQSQAGVVRDIAIGSAANAVGGNSIAIGTTSTTANTNGTAIGNASAANFDNSTALGFNAQTTANDQVMLGINASTVKVPGKLSIGPGSSIITNLLTASANLDFPSTAPSKTSDLSVTVTGCATNDIVQIGVPAVCAITNTLYFAFPSNDTVWVRFINNDTNTSQNPGPGVFKVLVTKF